MNFNINIGPGRSSRSSRRYATRHSTRKLHPAIAIVFGLFFIAFGFYSNYDDAKVKGTYKEAKGTVIDNIEREEYSGTSYNKTKKTLYYPVIQFTTDSGDTLEFQASSGYSSAIMKRVGSEIEIMYDPNNPSRARLKSKGMFHNVIPFLAGAAFIIFGIVGMIIRSRKKKQAQSQPEQPVNPVV